MATQENLNLAQQLYVAYYGRPADAEGQTFWADQIEANGLAAAVEGFGTSDEYTARFGDLSNEELINNLYQQAFNRDADQGGLDFYTEKLESGELTLSSIALTIVQNAANEDAQDATVLANKVAAAEAFTEAAGDDYSGDEASDYAANFLSGVGETEATVQEIADAVAGLPEPQEPTEPTDPGVPGEQFGLTATTDVVEGTADNDQFDAYLSQNQMVGGVSNTLSSADRIDGGDGNDSMYAQVIPEFFGIDGDDQIDIQPTVTDVETIEFESRDLGGNSTGGGTVTVDAKNIQGVNTIGSTQSDGDLVIENLTTLDSDGNARNTEELTISMDHTDNFNSDGDASDLTVYFDEDYLLSGQSSTISQANYWLLDEESEDYENAPLLNIERNGVELTIDGEPVVIEMDAETAANADTWEAYAAALQARIDEMVAEGNTTLEGISVIVDQDNLDSTFNDFGVEVDIPAITLLDSQSRELVPTGFVTPENATGAFDIYGDFDNVPAEQSQNPVTVNADLHKVGREGEGGNLVIGGKSQDDGEGEGIEVFNVDVLGDEAKPSNLGRIISTNDALRTINIATADEFVDGDTHASLTVRGEAGDLDPSSQAGSTPFGGTVDMINATQFLGDLTIGNETAASNVNTLNATGGGDVNFNASITAEGVYDYTTGEGEDSVTIGLDTDSIDTLGTSLDVDTNGGNDSVTVNSTVSSGDASQQTMAELDNVSINTGNGDDSVTINSNVRANIDAGAGSDFVYINSAANGGTGGTAGSWTFGQSSGPQNFGERVLYNAELTVTFAGFESTVVVPTDAEGNFVATQLEINEAIIDAIESHADLDRLLSTGEGEAARQLTITSLVDGENDLSIAINQPTVVASNPAATEVSVGSDDLTELVQGLIDTTTLNSDDLTSVAEFVTEFANEGLNGNVGEDGTNNGGTLYGEFAAGGSTDATSDVNFSVINMGNGEDDLIVMDSNEASANVLEVDGVFGEVSVVNFHDVSPNDLGGDKDNVGNHALDFTALLDNQEDPSSTPNTQSATDINVTLRDGNNPLSNPTAQNTNVATANSVNMARFDSTNTTSITFDSLSAEDVVTEFNADNTNGVFDYDLEASAFGTTLIGNTQKHVVMIENDQNAGEYKVFYLESTVDDSGTVVDGDFDASSAQELGTMDFGASINFNLVGSDEWETTIERLVAEADGREGDLPAQDVTVGEASGVSENAQYNIVDSLSNILGALTSSGSEDLADANSITVNNLENGNEEVAFTDLTDAAPATAIDFADDEATLTEAEALEIATAINSGDAKDHTDADALTITEATAGNLTAVNGQLGGDNDTIMLADDETVTLTSADFQGLNADLAATTPGQGTDATLTVTGVANGESLTATDLVDTFDVSGLTTDGDAAQIDGLAADDVISTGVTFDANEAVVDGDPAGTLQWSFDDATDTLTYETADANGSGDNAVTTVTLTGVASVTEDGGNFTIAGLDAA